ncbi:MAG: ATP-binding protein [Pseudomonadota bacterium]
MTATRQPLEDDDRVPMADGTAPRPAGPGDPIQPRSLSCRIGATAQDVSTFLADFTNATTAWPPDEAVLDDAAILLGEFLNNVVEHGEAGPAAEIQIDVTLDASHLRIATKDSGAPLPATCLADAALPEAGGRIDDLPEGGFGWFIIHQIASDIAYERVDGRNCLAFSIPTGPGQIPALDQDR